MDIEGLGTALVDLLVRQNLIHDYGDLYNLQEEQLIDLERMGRKSAQNLISAIEKSKRQSLDRLIFALGIPYIGITAARLLAEHFGDLKKIQKAGKEELESVAGIGTKMAEAIHIFFRSASTKALLLKLQQAGVQFSKIVLDRTDKLQGLTFVLSGTLPNLSREEATRIILRNGGKVTASISKNTSYLLLGAKAGSKLGEAKRLGIPAISEEEFLKLSS